MSTRRHAGAHSTEVQAPACCGATQVRHHNQANVATCTPEMWHSLPLCTDSGGSYVLMHCRLAAAARQPALQCRRTFKALFGNGGIQARKGLPHHVQALQLLQTATADVNY